MTSALRQPIACVRCGAVEFRHHATVLFECDPCRAELRSSEIPLAGVERSHKGPVVYVARDAAGEVLYVGTTVSIAGRLREHARSAPWRFDVACIVAQPATLADRSDHEARLIAELAPIWNVRRPAAAAGSSSATGPSTAGDVANPGGAPAASDRPGAMRGEGPTTTTGSIARPPTTPATSGRPTAAPVVALR